MDCPCPREIIANIHQIGSIPQSLAAVLKVINDPKAGADSVANVISRDVSLTTRVLKMVNSVQFGSRKKITKISEAVIIMGLNSIKILALSSSIFGMIQENETFRKCGIKRIWRHLIETAANARSIAVAAGYPDREEAFVAGIVHDIGTIVMLLYLREKYADIIDGLKQTKSGIIKVEKDNYGFSHCEIGAEIASLWKIPAKLVYVIRNHHDPDCPGMAEEDIMLNNIVSFADRMTLGPFEAYYPGIEDNIKFTKKMRDRLDLSQGTIHRIRKESVNESIKLAEYLDLDVGDVVDILSEANEKLADMYFSLEDLFIEIAAIPGRGETAARPI
jgi:putative nucleotidyltransferase with HDIG domain